MTHKPSVRLPEDLHVCFDFWVLGGTQSWMLIANTIERLQYAWLAIHSKS